MTTEEIAKGLVALCKEMKFDEAMEKYYSNDIVSIEPRPGFTGPALRSGGGSGTGWPSSVRGSTSVLNCANALPLANAAAATPPPNNCLRVR